MLVIIEIGIIICLCQNLVKNCLSPRVGRGVARAQGGSRCGLARDAKPLKKQGPTPGEAMFVLKLKEFYAGLRRKAG